MSKRKGESSKALALKPGERRPHPTLPNVTLTGPDPVDDYEMPEDTTNKSRFKLVGRGVPHTREERLKWTRATFVTVGQDHLTLTLSDGRSLVLPLDWSVRLPHGTPAERNTWRLLMDGIAVRWPLLGEIISVEEALAGRRPGEDEATLQQWIEERRKAAEQETHGTPQAQPRARRKAG